jgi:uncharacterized protein (DUF2147 family)
MKRLALLAGCALALAAGTAFAKEELAASAGPLGRWVTSSGNLEVEIAPCGDALCGTVVKVLANRSMSRAGEEMTPADPRDPMGMRVLTDFVASEFSDEGGARAPVEWRGHIYNRENAKTYRCIMTMGAAGELMLRGYVGIPLFGSTSAWTRAGAEVLGEAR